MAQLRRIRTPRSLGAHRHSIHRMVSAALHSIAAAGGSTVGVRLRSEGSDNGCVIPMVDACMYTRAVFSQPSL